MLFVVVVVVVSDFIYRLGMNACMIFQEHEREGGNLIGSPFNECIHVRPCMKRKPIHVSGCAVNHG